MQHEFMRQRYGIASFSIYTCKRKDGKSVYYARFKNPDGTYSTDKTTGQPTRRDAVKWCEDELLRNGTPKGRYSWDMSAIYLQHQQA
jgi:hypothetical protein